jgi:AcrR family transcriptional regulator
VVEPHGHMPLARYDSIDVVLKKRILDVSKQEFANHGYEDASYNKIIQKIGISKGSMYYYFENKEDLFITCILDEVSATGSFSSKVVSFSKIDDIEMYWDSMKVLCSRQWNNAFQHPLLMSLIRQMASLGSEHPIVCKLNVECEDLSEYGDLISILVHGVHIGAIRNDIPLSVLTRMSTVYEVWLLQELQNELVDEQQVVEKFFEMFKQLFETRR